jgi:hypothetical protein
LPRRAFAPQQAQVGVVQHQLHEAGVLVGEPLVDLFVLLLALAPLLPQEHQDRERQANDRHDVAQQFPGFAVPHAGRVAAPLPRT